MTEFVTHDVKRFILNRPENFSFTPGQGVELVIDQGKWREEQGRPFTLPVWSLTGYWSLSSRNIPGIRPLQTGCTV